jgi:hypothetical protein
MSCPLPPQELRIAYRAFLPLPTSSNILRIFITYSASSAKSTLNVRGDTVSQIQFPVRSLGFAINLILESSQPLTNISIRNLHGDKDGRRTGLTTSPPSVSWLSRTMVFKLGYAYPGIRENILRGMQHCKKLFHDKHWIIRSYLRLVAGGPNVRTFD